ncbi:MAG: hypothetical protein ACMUHX_12270, partial [bacterium]
SILPVEVSTKLTNYSYSSYTSYQNLSMISNDGSTYTFHPEAYSYSDPKTNASCSLFAVYSSHHRGKNEMGKQSALGHGLCP